MLMKFEIVGFQRNPMTHEIIAFDLIEFIRITLNRIISEKNILAYCLAAITWLST